MLYKAQFLCSRWHSLHVTVTYLKKVFIETSKKYILSVCKKQYHSILIRQLRKALASKDGFLLVETLQMNEDTP